MLVDHEWIRNHKYEIEVGIWFLTLGGGGVRDWIETWNERTVYLDEREGTYST